MDFDHKFNPIKGVPPIKKGLVPSGTRVALSTTKEVGTPWSPKQLSTPLWAYVPGFGTLPPPPAMLVKDALVTFKSIL